MADREYEVLRAVADVRCPNCGHESKLRMTEGLGAWQIRERDAYCSECKEEED